MGRAGDHVAAVVLAAGYSSRMGDAFKPLLKIGGHTAVECAVMSHLDAGIADVTVVVGYRADEVAEAVGHLGIRIVRNRNFDTGMFSSIQAGVATLEPQVQAFFILPADIPLVKPATIRAICITYEMNCCGIAYPVYRGRRGHPPLITGRYISEIMESPAPDGLRGILRGHEAEACAVPVNDEAVLLDIDTMDDYHRLLHYRNRECIPNLEQCMSLLEEAKTDGSVRDHCSKVAAVACQLVSLLNSAGADLNRELVHSAALLHDIRRDQRDHARAGALFLRSHGYAPVAEVVAVHMDIECADGEIPTEAEIVYLADKMVMGGHCVPLESRFAAALERYKGDEAIRGSILRRREQADRIKRKVENLIGCALEALPPMSSVDPVQENLREEHICD
ncbi:MAG: NTP transferase domain-containing protein [Spirochaetes bacterium]|nr:NTP transferase domain-containing protein [Spirochaetota bacterium]